MPAVLHWFKFEALYTWISGILLLGVVYYMGSGALLLDSNIRALSVPAALGITGALLLGSWLLYDKLWQSPLARSPLLAAGISAAFVVLCSWGLTELYSARAAYLHVGAVLGTVMVANVWMRILPAQTAMLAATRAGQKQDPALGLAAKTRSKHNNYMTFPVIFIMVSTHYPSTYGHPLAWAVLAGIMLTAGVVKHFMNLERTFRHWFEASIAATLVGVGALYFVTLPAPTTAAVDSSGPAVAWSDVQPILANRCVTCHSARPTNAAIRLAASRDTTSSRRQHVGGVVGPEASRWP
jgi:uncharacterized membrane protein